MNIKQYLITSKDDIQIERSTESQLVLIFGHKPLLADEETIAKITEAFPSAYKVYSSTAGEIMGQNVYDETITITAITFDSTRIEATANNITDFENSYEAGKALASNVDQEGLRFVFMISDGRLVNGSDLLNGINAVIAPEIPITGALAGDGTSFENTLTGLDDTIKSGQIVAISFYGKKLKVSHSSMGGWDSFGLEREVTKSVGNVLYEIDGKNVLSLYKTYLGKYVDDLPGSALLFPLSIEINDAGDTIVRTILSVDHEEETMSLAGNIPTGSKVRFMKANFDKLIDAASIAAQQCLTDFDDIQPELAILISCVGRKAILSERTDEEVEAVKDRLSKDTSITGFYSYGEISPIKQGGTCELHNQTMTITCLQEEL